MEIIYTILCIACLCVGFFVGYRINKPKPTSIVARKVESKKERIENTIDTLNLLFLLFIFPTVLWFEGFAMTSADYYAELEDCR